MWWWIYNVFDFLGEAVAAVASVWTMMMLALWNSGLWVLRIAMQLFAYVTTPDVSEAGPARSIYQTTFWMAGALVLALMMIQLGITLVRRDGQSMARVLIGVAQFGLVVTSWIAYAVTVIAACGGLTSALLKQLLDVEVLAAWQPWSRFEVGDITDGVLATALGVMGVLLWLSSLGHLLVMLVRAVALVVLVATAPVAGAGLVWAGGTSWFWKAFRWFHAAAFTPVLMVLLLGTGVQISGTVVMPGDDDLGKAIGTALASILIILISCFSPLALFKLLAFVDPGSSSGAALRQGMAANGGIQGLLRGSSSGGGEAASSSSGGRASGEVAGDAATSSRFAGGSAGGGSAAGAGSAGAGSAGAGSAGAGSAGAAGGSSAAAGGGAAAAGAGPIGAVLAAGAAVYGGMARVGTQGGAMVADVGNQAGIGHDVYQPDAPDFGRQRTDPAARATAAREGGQAGPDQGSAGGQGQGAAASSSASAGAAR